MSASEGGSSEGRVSKWGQVGAKLLRTGAPAHAQSIAGPSFMSAPELSPAIVLATSRNANSTAASSDAKKSNKVYSNISSSSVALSKTTLGQKASAIELTIDNPSLPSLPPPDTQSDANMSNLHNVYGIPGAPATLWPADTYYFAKNTNVQTSNNPASSSSSSLSSGRRSSATPAEMQLSNSASRSGRPIPLTRAASSGSSFRKRSSDYTSVAAPANPSQNTPALFPLSPPPKSKRRPATAVASIAVPATSVESLSGTPSAGSHSDHIPVASENKQRQPSFSVTSPRHSDMIRKYFKTKNGKRHHAFPSKRAPYPRSYDSQAIDQCVPFTYMYITNEREELIYL